jgi:hypothetical protein
MLLERQVAYKIMKSCLTFVVHFFGVQLMLQKDIAKIPDAHIMKRWTKDARDVLSGPLKHTKRIKQQDNQQRSGTV